MYMHDQYAVILFAGNSVAQYLLFVLIVDDAFMSHIKLTLERFNKRCIFCILH